MGSEALGFVSEILKVFFTLSLHQQIVQVLELKNRGHRGKEAPGVKNGATKGYWGEPHPWQSLGVNGLH